MKTIFFTLLQTLTLALILSLNTPVYAAANGISKQQAVNIAQQVHPGRVLAVKRKGEVYRVKTLNDKGEVRIILIDANSGKVISGS
jgi:uncharacterized membrane protein YkoI